MARQNQAVEFSTFVKGLITEASPLTFPENASLDEDNFVLRRDGSRERRLGIDAEDNYGIVTAFTSPSPDGELPVSTFSWENVGGIANKTVAVVQTGGVVKLFDTSTFPLSHNSVASYEISAGILGQVFSYANIDGRLIIASGNRDLTIISYDGTTFSMSTDYIRTRDQWGVEDWVGGVNLFEGQGITVRPFPLTSAHTYNLRNQTWGPPRERDEEGRTVVDPITYFYSETDGSKYPSNADNLNYALYANANDESNRTGDQFHTRDLISNPPGTFPAARGYFIIDAMNRGQSRVEEVQKLEAQYPELDNPVISLRGDQTPGGPTCLSEYAGRVWYGGFSSEVVDGDARSPRLSSYVFYSQLVNDPSQITACYQEGDPTSKENPDLLDTDGGFMRIDGAYNIQALVNIGTGLMVLAENGVWMITGGSDYGFSANNNMRRHISDRGIQSPGSVVRVDDSFFFWADDAIYRVGPNQFGDYQAENLTKATIQRFFDNIDPEDKVFAQGSYDSYNQKIRWVYQNRVAEDMESRELILDLNLQAFYTNTFRNFPGEKLPRVVAPIEVPAFQSDAGLEEVVNDGEEVVFGTEQVVQQVTRRETSATELVYLVITFFGIGSVQYTFANFRDSSFRDWKSLDPQQVGVDANAYLLTGYLSGGEHQRYKQVPYIQFYFRRTEDGFFDDGTGNLFPRDPSSCLVQAQWEWANSAKSNRWGRTFQAYRYRRHYLATGTQDEYDTGFEVIVTKNKLRGKGRVLSLLISTEPDKDCRLLGWAMLVGVTGNV